MKKRVKLIANPVAGKGARGNIEKARKYLLKAGCDVDLTITGARGEAEKAAASAKEETFDKILAAGGDGTLNEVVNGLVPSRIPLGFLPLGTTNVLALELGIPFDIEKACDIFLNGAPKPVSVGDANGRRFILMAGVGLDAEAVYRVSLTLKRWTGKLAYVISALKILVQGRSMPIKLLFENGEVIDGNTVIISNGKLYGGKFAIAPKANLEEDALDVCVFKKLKRHNLIKYLALIVGGKEIQSDDVATFKVKEVTVEGKNIPVQIDGDYFGKLPLTFRSCPDELRLIMPA